jgi:hypothetical protein
LPGTTIEIAAQPWKWNDAPTITISCLILIVYFAGWIPNYLYTYRKFKK